MKKILITIAAVVALLIASLSVYAIATAKRSERPVGLTLVQVKTAQGPMTLGIWYPTTNRPLPTTFLGGSLLDVAREGALSGKGHPVLLVSHGNGGGLASHADTAMEFASAGYVVATPMHIGDNYLDQSGAATASLFQDRAAQMKASLDYLLHDWPHRSQLNAARVGAFGFSAGGFTVLNLIGGVTNLSAIPVECAARPEFFCNVLRQVHSPLIDPHSPAQPEFVRDARIKAAVVAAPGLGFTFAGRGLHDVRIPVQVWYGTADTTVPFATNTGVVLAGLGRRADTRPIPGATHFSFLAPCGLLKPSTFCRDPDGFNRESAHRAMNAQMLAFFDKNLH